MSSTILQAVSQLDADTLRNKLELAIKATNPVYIKPNTIDTLLKICKLFLKTPQLTCRTIASSLGMSINSVRNYYMNRLLKLGIVKLREMYRNRGGSYEKVYELV